MSEATTQTLTSIQAVMNVGCPDSSGKQQQLEGQEVHGHNEEHPAVGQRLQGGCIQSVLLSCAARIVLD